MAAPDSPTALTEWENFVDGLRPRGTSARALLWNPDDAQVRQELGELMLRGLAHGYVGNVYADPDYPEFVPSLGLFLNIAAPVPDFMYQGTPIRGDGVYRISGNVGTSLFVDVNVNSGYWANGTGGKTLNAYRLEDLTIAPDGGFDVILSNERPEGYSGDWWRLDPQGRRLGARRAAYDWLNEIDARLTIERLDLPARRPRRPKEDIARRMTELTDWVEIATVKWLEHINAQKAKAVVNDLVVHDYSHMGGADGQTYLEGLYDLAPDEALLIDTEVPQVCRYWSFLVTDELFATLDWMHRFSSINGHQAKLSSDGRFRAVISAEDPGVPNWIDIGGYRTGLIQGRWNNPSSAPIPTCTRMKLADVWKHMPNDTPKVSARERDELLRLRRKGAQMRQVW